MDQRIATFQGYAQVFIYGQSRQQLSSRSYRGNEIESIVLSTVLSKST